MSRYDIAIIGTGPAGLSAAITATIRNKKVLLLGSRDLTLKLQKAHEIQNYLGFPAVSGADLAAAFQRHIDQMGIEITEKRINAVYAMGDYFALQSGDEMVEASSVILAHNHPDGQMRSSREDDAVTRQVYDSLKTVGIRLTDHLIFARGGVFSYQDSGAMQILGFY